jgi:outer membrane receptor protein involved in Fe transport
LRISRQIVSTSAKDLQKQGVRRQEAGARKQNLAQNSQQAQITRVTGTEVKQTPSGVQLILKTAPGQPKLVPLILPEGNNLVIELLDATIAFSIRNGVTQTRPAPGIKEVRVSKSNISLDDVEQIEVLKGPAGVLYGSGQPGGTINITTKQPQREPSYQLQGIIGNVEF